MRYIYLVTIALALAGCSQEPAPQEPASERAPATDAVVGVENRSPALVLPGDAVLTTATHLRSDKTHETKRGAIRRRIVLELLDVGPGEAYQAIASDLERAGYERSRQTDRKDGSYTVTFRKPEAKTLSVRFYPTLAKRPSHAGAKSMIAMSWELRKASKSSPAGSNDD